MVKEIKYPYPSRFGSHTSMIKEDCGSQHVICIDEFGEYITNRSNIDSGLVDVERCRESRLRKLFEKRHIEKTT